MHGQAHLLEVVLARRPIGCFADLLHRGNKRSAMRMAMIAITTKSSIMVKPSLRSACLDRTVGKNIKAPYEGKFIRGN